MSDAWLSESHPLLLLGYAAVLASLRNKRHRTRVSAHLSLVMQVDALLDRHGVKFDGPGETHVVPLTLEVFVAQKV